MWVGENYLLSFLKRTGRKVLRSEKGTHKRHGTQKRTTKPQFYEHFCLPNQIRTLSFTQNWYRLVCIQKYSEIMTS